MQWDQYNALTQPMSQLALGAGGRLMAIGFCATGLGILLLALLIPRTVHAHFLSIAVAVRGFRRAAA